MCKFMLKFCIRWFQGTVLFSSLLFYNRFSSLITSSLITSSLITSSLLSLLFSINHLSSLIQGLNWKDLYDMKLPALWVPPIKGALDSSMFDAYDEDEGVATYHDDGTGWDSEF